MDVYIVGIDVGRLPTELHIYYGFVPLDDTSERSAKVFGYPTWVYRATSKVDGSPYVLRRIEGCSIFSQQTPTSSVLIVVEARFSTIERKRNVSD